MIQKKVAVQKSDGGTKASGNQYLPLQKNL